MPALHATRVARLPPESLVVAAAIPFIFLHPHYQPSWTAGSVTVTLTDLAILAAVVAALVAGYRQGWAPLRAGVTVWVPAMGFLALLLASLLWAANADPQYRLGAHLVSALKFVEYALLAPVIPLTLRRAEDRRALLWSVALWSAFLSLVGVLQFLGVLDEFNGKRPQQREPSYIGIHDLGAISGAALSLAFAAIVLGSRRRRLAVVGGVGGAFGVAVAAGLDAVAGIVVAAAATWALARRRGPVEARRTLALIALTAVVTLGAVSLRGAAIGAFLEFLGVSPPSTETDANVQTGSQRALLAYIGGKIWLRHPVLGVGWQESALPHSYRPVLAAAHRRFPHVAAASFPSVDHAWGVQNGVVQTLADLGAVGFVLLAWLLVSGFALAARVALRGPPALAGEGLATCSWLIVGLLVFAETGLLAGVAVNALLWIALGLAVTLHRALTTAG